MDSELQTKKIEIENSTVTGSAILNLENGFIMTRQLKRCFACSVKRQSKLMASQKGVEILTPLLCVCLSNCLQDLNKKLVDQKGFIKNLKKNR